MLAAIEENATERHVEDHSERHVKMTGQATVCANLDVWGVLLRSMKTRSHEFTCDSLDTMQRGPIRAPPFYAGGQPLPKTFYGGVYSLIGRIVEMPSTWKF